MGLLSLCFLSVFAVFQTTLGRASFNVDNLGISGGHKILISDAPYMAGLFDAAGQICGGSIIHERFILTSARCVKYMYRIVKVHIGSKHVNDSGIFINIDKELCHEEYDKRTFDNDICLLKLRDQITFSKNISKVELPDENFEIVQGTMVNITGWGNKGNGDYPAILQQTTVTIKSKEACLEIDSTMTDNAFCAGSPTRDVCDGDVGGPLTVNNVQIGIVSYSISESCGSQPSFFTKVSKYVNWIRNKISANS